MKSFNPGQIVQIDHTTVSKTISAESIFKHGIPQFMHARLYSNAESRPTRKSLVDLVQKIPFKISLIQVDGGSEFMEDFEQACAELHIAPFVLPPKRPQYNGSAERANRTFKEILCQKEYLR